MCCEGQDGVKIWKLPDWKLIRSIPKESGRGAMTALVCLVYGTMTGCLVTLRHCEKDVCLCFA